MKNRGIRKVIRSSLSLPISVQVNFSSTINMRWKDSVKSLACRGHLLPFYELMKLAVLAKQTFILPQNQQVRLYGNFVILTRFLESLLQQVSGSCLIFVKKNIKKHTNHKLCVANSFSRWNDLFLKFWSGIGAFFWFFIVI